ncbi:hypothetical protein DXB65_13290 [Bacteroides oleiciplenus]|uniref:Uncharacterized protein n=1 Tax=Bacteroides oleiciplenus TaxID=626931 RepID=A0A3E5BAX5_9BACE|nr:hypothetical protein DXB65_13290 [Bacteroides oleiciplenus]
MAGKSRKEFSIKNKKIEYKYHIPKKKLISGQKFSFVTPGSHPLRFYKRMEIAKQIRRGYEGGTKKLRGGINCSVFLSLKQLNSYL